MEICIWGREHISQLDQTGQNGGPRAACSPIASPMQPVIVFFCLPNVTFLMKISIFEETGVIKRVYNCKVSKKFWSAGHL